MTASATAAGKVPPPQISASGPLRAGALRSCGDRPIAGLRRASVMVYSKSSTCPRSRVIMTGRLALRRNATIWATCGTSACSAATCIDARGEFALAFEQCLVGGAHRRDAGARHAAPPHPDHVDAGEPRRRIEHVAVRDHVLAHRRIARHHRALAEPGELVHDAVAAEEHVVLDLDMAADRRIVGEHDIVADVAVMRHMRADHQEAVVADAW